uniref:MYND-type domain-containing protein n=1 Tax=Strigamia maritima TaxID=126957 RepID=T1INS6_STRMM
MKTGSAINLYTEAMKLKKLSRNDLGELYVNRCELYLQEPSKNIDLLMFKKRNNNQSALEDAKRAVELCPRWIKAHLSLGRAYYAINKWEKALKCIDFASQLDKLPPGVFEIREKCKVMMKLTEEMPIFGEKVPQNDEEMINMVNKRAGMNLTMEMAQEMKKKLKNSNDPNAVVWRAHRHMLGFDGFEKNCKLGVELYTKAALAGNAEAKFNLGVIYKEGKHLARDLKKAVKLLEGAANVVSKTGYKLVGVSEAQFELGNMYMSGKGVSRDTEKAIHWFMKSSENGGKMAPNILGNFYFHGNCVEKNVRKAVQFWELAAQRYDVISMQSLAEYYLAYDVDPSKALQWHQRALETGEIEENSSKAFISMVEDIKRDFKAGDEEMKRWEKKNGFTQFDCAMPDRRERYLESKLPGSAQFGKYLQSLRTSTSECLPCSITTTGKVTFDEDVINEYAAKGYVTAIKFQKAVIHFQTGSLYLKLFGRQCWSLIVHELAQSFRITEKILENYETHSKAIDVVDWAMRSVAERQNCEIDRDLRVCYVILHANNMIETIEFLRESIRLYPNDIWFQETLCSFLGFVNAHEEGIKMANEGLAKDPDNLEFLYLRSAHLRNMKRMDKKAVTEAQEKFLAVAPPDHLKVPQVYYSLAFDHIRAAGKTENPKSNPKTRNMTMDVVAKYYKLGLEAENHQIPCFLPVKCDQKTILDEMMALKPFRTAVNRLQTLKTEVKTAENPSKPKTEVKTAENPSKPKKAAKITKKTGTPKKEDTEILIEQARLAKLTNPQREGVIRDHREVIFNLKKQLRSMKSSRSFTANITYQTKMKQEGPPQLSEVKSITLQEMDPLKEHIYNGFAFKCVVIDEPTLGFTGVGIVVEDENGDVQRACVYNISQDESVHGKIGYGCRITILNPYFRIAVDQKAIIRVDDVESVIFESGPDRSRCRYCGKTGAVKTCGRCSKACYCSRECQIGDWKILRHKFVCGSL